LIGAIRAARVWIRARRYGDFDQTSGDRYPHQITAGVDEYRRKTRILASITVQKTADSLSRNFLRGSAERPVLTRATLSQALLWQRLAETTLRARKSDFARHSISEFFNNIDVKRT
jgi:hypothetical protein